MVKTETTDNICLVEISIESSINASMDIIKSALTNEGVFPVFMSRSKVFGGIEKLTVAIDSEELFPMMKIMGSIRHRAGITNYSINCSNSMIKWENKNFENIDKICVDDKDVKLVYIWEDKGICFCESSSVNKICAQLM